MRLGTWLLGRGRITEDQLQRALQHQKFFGGRIGSSLIKLGYIDEDALGDYLAAVSGAPYASPSRLDNVPAEVVALVPARLAEQYMVMPVAAEGRRLRLAMCDPKDLIALDEIAFLTGMTIEPWVATEYRIHQALARYYQLATDAPSIPVTPAAAGGRPAASPAAHRPEDPRRGSGRDEVGFDGYPIDADPAHVDIPFAGRSGTASPAAYDAEDTPPPTSLEQWRMAQREIPDVLPDPPPPVPWGAVRGTAAPAAAPVEIPTQPALVTVEPGLDECARRLQKTETRDEVFGVVLDYTSARFSRSALFVVQSDRVVGWGGRGPGIDAARVRLVTVPLDRPSLFTPLRNGADHYYGPVTDHPTNTRLFLDLGVPAPERALVLPLLIKDRPTVLLYADNGADASGAPDIPAFRRLLAKAALALEILILKNKILSR